MSTIIALRLVKKSGTKSSKLSKILVWRASSKRTATPEMSKNTGSTLITKKSSARKNLGSGRKARNCHRKVVRLASVLRKRVKTRNRTEFWNLVFTPRKRFIRSYETCRNNQDAAREIKP